VPPGVRRDWLRDEAIAYLLRGRLECVGPIAETELAHTFGLQLRKSSRLITLENQASCFAPLHGPTEQEWCERRLLAHSRLTSTGFVSRLPRLAEQFVRFWRTHARSARNPAFGQPALLSLLEKLEGFEAPAGTGKYLLPARLQSYNPAGSTP